MVIGGARPVEVNLHFLASEALMNISSGLAKAGVMKQPTMEKPAEEPANASK